MNSETWQELIGSTVKFGYLVGPESLGHYWQSYCRQQQVPFIHIQPLRRWARLTIDLDPLWDTKFDIKLSKSHHHRWWSVADQMCKDIEARPKDEQRNLAARNAGIWGGGSYITARGFPVDTLRPLAELAVLLLREAAVSSEERPVKDDL